MILKKFDKLNLFKFYNSSKLIYYDFSSLTRMSISGLGR